MGHIPLYFITVSPTPTGRIESRTIMVPVKKVGCHWVQSESGSSAFKTELGSSDWGQCVHSSINFGKFGVSQGYFLEINIRIKTPRKF